MPQIIASSERCINNELTSQECAEIDMEINHYPDRQAVCIEALKIVQEHRGWVSDDSIQAIAHYLEMSSTQVDAVATFYNMIFREPVGEKVIFLCDSVSCWIMGCDKLKQQITQTLGIDYGQTTADGKYTLLPANCLGDCDKAPAMMINKKHYSLVDSDALKKILKEE